MEQEGLSFEECLEDAQRLGYAEANPSFDVDGHDTAQKLAILASLAFGTRVAESAIYVEGISSIALEDLRAAAELGYRVKLLGVAVRTAKGIEQRVHPTMVPKSSSIAQVMGVTNAVTIDGEGIPPITLVGHGLRRSCRHRRCRARRAGDPVWTPGRAPARHREGADGAA
jgi:homoserine dehydrogenase